MVDGLFGFIGDGGFKVEVGCYYLYVVYICFWVLCVLVVCVLKGFIDLIIVSVVNFCLSDQGWQFGGFFGSIVDEFNQVIYMYQIYMQVVLDFIGWVMVLVLWDKQQQIIVNNELVDIL